MNKVLGLALTALCFNYANGHADGAPEAACANLAPKHGGTTLQNSESPFSIIVDATEWSTDGAMSVSYTGANIHGFILQARRSSDNTGIGMFDSNNLPDSTKSGPCKLDGKMISVTHSDSNEKKNLTFLWSAPGEENYEGDIYFQGAVAENRTTYWVNIKSVTLPREGVVPSNDTTSTASTTVTTTSTEGTTVTKVVKTTTKETVKTTAAGSVPSLCSALLVVIVALMA